MYYKFLQLLLMLRFKIDQIEVDFDEEVVVHFVGAVEGPTLILGLQIEDRIQINLPIAVTRTEEIQIFANEMTTTSLEAVVVNTVVSSC